MAKRNFRLLMLIVSWENHISTWNVGKKCITEEGYSKPFQSAGLSLDKMVTVVEFTIMKGWQYVTPAHRNNCIMQRSIKPGPSSRAEWSSFCYGYEQGYYLIWPWKGSLPLAEEWFQHYPLETYTVKQRAFIASPHLPKIPVNLHACRFFFPTIIPVQKRL